MTLASKNVLVFAATGSVGRATAMRLAADGAHVWLSSRNETAVQELAEQISAEGGTASAAAVDATDERQVGAYVDRVAERAGGIDGAFNAIGIPPAEGGFPALSTQVDAATFLRPLKVIALSTFLTSTAGARHMTARGSGSIVTLSASLSGSQTPWMAALTATCGAVEALTRALASEFGPAGVRVNCERADAMPDTDSIRQTGEGMAALGVPLDAFISGVSTNPLGRPLTTGDTAAAVAFLLSDAAAGISYQTVNVTSRALAG